MTEGCGMFWYGNGRQVVSFYAMAEGEEWVVLCDGIGDIERVGLCLRKRDKKLNYNGVKWQVMIIVTNNNLGMKENVRFIRFFINLLVLLNLWHIIQNDKNFI